MKITVVNGTNRLGNKTLPISQKVVELSGRLGLEASLVDLNNFTELFRGEYLTLKNALGPKREDLEKILASQLIIFIVPTYHHGLPGSLKNFLDLVKAPEIYEGKVIGFMASSNKNHDLGARQAREVVEGLFAYQKSIAVIVPKIAILGFENIDEERILDHLNYCLIFFRSFPEEGKRFPQEK